MSNLGLFGGGAGKTNTDPQTSDLFPKSDLKFGENWSQQARDTNSDKSEYPSSFSGFQNPKVWDLDRQNTKMKRNPMEVNLQSLDEKDLKTDFDSKETYPSFDDLGFTSDTHYQYYGENDRLILRFKSSEMNIFAGLVFFSRMARRGIGHWDCKLVGGIPTFYVTKCEELYTPQMIDFLAKVGNALSWFRKAFNVNSNNHTITVSKERFNDYGNNGFHGCSLNQCEEHLKHLDVFLTNPKMYDHLLEEVKQQFNGQSARTFGTHHPVRQ